MKRPIQENADGASTILQRVVSQNRSTGEGGVYAVCSAHPRVIDAAIQQAIENDSILLVESTSSQVNQFGGYTQQTPSQFAAFVHAAAQRIGLPEEKILLGGDHLGPFPWKTAASQDALRNAGELVRACVLAGYKKIHLDASMACADDPAILPEQTVAERAAILCEKSEGALKDLPPESAPPLYVIGTEVPVPGGESASGASPAVTTVEALNETVMAFERAFEARGVSQAWQRVVGLVVQPGVEFGDDIVFEYDGKKARALAQSLPQSPSLVFEAHSTDYQNLQALSQMVNDHFAILKVGPWLTFAFREAIFALSDIERELFSGEKSRTLSQVREALDRAMLQNPMYWRSYYRGDENQLRLSRAYSSSDRCRYYWHEASVQAEVERLMANLDISIPLTLISQFLPLEYSAIKSHEIDPRPQSMIEYHIRLVLRTYASACGNCVTEAC